MQLSSSPRISLHCALSHTISPCDGAACGNSGDPQKSASVQVNSGVTKRRRGWRPPLNRDGGGCRVTCTCARTTCPDWIHLHTKKKKKNPHHHVPSYTTCGSVQTRVEGQSSVGWDSGVYVSTLTPPAQKVELCHQLPPVSTQHLHWCLGLRLH